MAFTDPIVLQDNAAANQNFTRRTGITILGSDWVEDDATASNERTLAIRHSKAGPSVTPGAPPKQRHLLQFQLRKYNSLIAKVEQFGINLTFIDDASSSITAAEKYHVLAFAKNILTTGNLDKILRGES